MSFSLFVIETTIIQSEALPPSHSANNLGQSIVVGIVSGLLSTFLAWVIYHLFHDAFLPWYQKKLYRGTIVAGSWSGERKDTDALYGFTVELFQNGHQLSGTFHAQNQKPDGAQTKKTFILQGEITNSCVLLNYSPADKHIYGSGSFLLHVFDAGNALKGGMLFFKTRTGRIGCVDDLELKRTRQ